MIIKVSSVCHAFDASCVGTRVISAHHHVLMACIAKELASYEMPTNGKGIVGLPGSSYGLLFSGDTERAGLKASDFIVREWRGEMMMFAKRRGTRPQDPSFAAAIVYTKAAYLTDPEVDDEERARMEDATHVLVAVLGSRGPKPTLSSARFVRNLAGGNASFAPGERSYTDLVSMAKEIVAYESAYESAWVTVADEE